MIPVFRWLFLGVLPVPVRRPGVIEKLADDALARFVDNQARLFVGLHFESVLHGFDSGLHVFASGERENPGGV
jgi:hypothetical protein